MLFSWGSLFARLNICGRFVGLLVVLFCCRGKSQDSSSTLNFSEGASLSNKSRTQTGLEYEFTQYFSEIPGNPKLNQSQLLRADIDSQFKGSRWNKKLEMTGISNVDWGTSLLGVNQAYTQSSGLNSSFTLGRKKEFWSGIDHAWKLSMWQPLLNLNPLDPAEQGLTGAFYNYSVGDNDFLIFATPIFIPTMGPEIKEKDKSLVSDSRWFQSPSSTYSLFNKEIKVLYSLEEVKMQDLVFKPGFGVRYRFNPDKPGNYLNLHFGRKPINALSLRYERFLLANGNNDQNGVAVVGPVVTYHQLGGVDFGMRTPDKDKFEISILFENPEKSNPQQVDSNSRIQWLQQQPQPLAAINLGVETFYGLDVEDDLKVHADLMRLQTLPTVDVDSKGQVQGSLFPRRTNFTSALKLGAVFSTAFIQSVYALSVDWIRDFDQQGDVLSFGGKWSRRSLSARLALDVLAVDQAKDNFDDRFINKFRGNDRVTAGLGYVF